MLLGAAGAGVPAACPIECGCNAKPIEPYKCLWVVFLSLYWCVFDGCAAAAFSNSMDVCRLFLLRDTFNKPRPPLLLPPSRSQ